MSTFYESERIISATQETFPYSSDHHVVGGTDVQLQFNPTNDYWRFDNIQNHMSFTVLNGNTLNFYVYVRRVGVNIGNLNASDILASGSNAGLTVNATLHPYPDNFIFLPSDEIRCQVTGGSNSLIINGGIIILKRAYERFI